MANESPFNKRLTAETNLDKVEGLLEHFNLPPKAITFIRANHRILQFAIAFIVIAVVCWSLYGSYRERRQEEAASALSLALQDDKAAQEKALAAIVEQYGSTSSALWARLELAHLDMQKGAFAEASKKYAAILSDVETRNPVYPLILFGLAQAMEADKKFQEAAAQYNLLKNIKGFEYIAYVGLGRIEEAQGNTGKAIAIYNDFLLTLGDEPSAAQIKSQITGKIADLKARQ